MKIDETKLTPIDLQVLSSLEMHRAEVLIGKKLMRLDHRQFGRIELEPKDFLPGWQLVHRSDAAVNNRLLSWRGSILAGQFHRKMMRSGMVEDVEVGTANAAAAVRAQGAVGAYPGGGLTTATQTGTAASHALQQAKMQKMMEQQQKLWANQIINHYRADMIDAVTHGLQMGPNPSKVNPPSS